MNDFPTNSFAQEGVTGRGVGPFLLPFPQKIPYSTTASRHEVTGRESHVARTAGLLLAAPYSHRSSKH